MAQDEDMPEELVEHLTVRYQRRVRQLARELHAQIPAQGIREGEPIRSPRMQLLQNLINTQREAIIRLRDDGEISDEALHQVERELDLDDSRLRESM
jgi:CPA1 family monovalent cation:H+ antiporter